MEPTEVKVEALTQEDAPKVTKDQREDKPQVHTAAAAHTDTHTSEGLMGDGEPDDWNVQGVIKWNLGLLKIMGNF